MRKKIMCFLTALMAMFAFAVSVAADDTSGAQLNYVTDAAGILSDDEDTKLETMAETVSKKYGVGVYIVTVEDYQEISNDGAYTATYTIYHEYTMGEGEDRDGIMLLLSMEDRDYGLFCYGEQSEYAFNKYGQEKLEECFLDNFGNDDWYGGFEDYISECSTYLQKAQEGTPVRKSLVVPILIVTGVSLLIALVVLIYLWICMDNVDAKTTANDYVVGKFNLTAQSDIFTHRTETRVFVESDSSSGGHSHSGGGGSGRSGKF